MISVIVPCYNEEAVLTAFHTLVSEQLKGIGDDYELIYVNDGSSDQTPAILKQMASAEANVHYLSFSRNFGKEAAVYAGLCNAKGDYIALMDADLQDPPELLKEMRKALDSGEYDCAAARRTDRTGEPVIRSFFSRSFYGWMNRLSGIDIPEGARDYRMMTQDMCDAVISLSESNRFSKGIFAWVGFRTKWIPYTNRDRAAGNTKWSFRKLFRYAIDGITSFSQAPLTLSSIFGMVMTLIALIMILVIIVRKLIFGDPVQGWASLMCVIIFIGGIQLMCIGIMGQYIAKTYLETKARPHYILSDTDLKDAQKIR